MIDIRGLAYIVVEASDTDKWKHFGEQVMGCMATDAPDRGLYLKMDARPYRYLIVHGQHDKYLASGWEVLTQCAFDEAVVELNRAGVEIMPASPEELAARKFQNMVWFFDPSGNRHEIVWGCQSDFVRFDSPVGVPEFVTGELGLGHTVLSAPKFDETWTFFRDVMGFGLSDIYRHQAGADKEVQRLHFTHCNNGRQHSLALFEAPHPPSGCVHVMAEVSSMTEVGRALDRCARHGVKLMASLGQHVNDEVISFYVLTPGGFALEYGYGGLVVDWEKHSVFEATSISHWGHDWSLGLADSAH
ncbi:VOC family protein [Paraburkholderia sacchari]|uniref:VOC family protein n=1 Tax=Paraburkholderia sacchari TaxID=159450 RepID=UPI00054371F1|nr:VOC family protein [Paraburkholderia sacchari]NLP64870.1 biphenyl 2,3-dioxygenase [Paraburkholderia sacchari]